MVLHVFVVKHVKHTFIVAARAEFADIQEPTSISVQKILLIFFQLFLKE
jgi:hypothetical protein